MRTELYLLDHPRSIGSAETWAGCQDVLALHVGCLPCDVDLIHGEDVNGEIEWLLVRGEIVGSLDRVASLRAQWRDAA